MKEWSLKALAPEWKVTIYLDTNILISLSDKPSIGLAFAFSLLKEKNSFLQLISSQYALFEYTENRKKDIYISLVKENFNPIPLKTKFINWLRRKPNSLFSSAVVDRFDIPGNPYLPHWKTVTEFVDAEIQKLRSDFEIVYEDNVFHEDLFRYTKSLCLASCIGREDCMITTSAVFPRDSNPIEGLIIWTNDSHYYSSYYNCPELNSIFSNGKPYVEFLRKMPKGIGAFDVYNCTKEATVKRYLINQIKSYLIRKNSLTFLGISTNGVNLKNTIVIRKRDEYVIPANNGIYLTVISKNLDFILSSKKIDNLWYNGNQVDVADYPLTGNGEISVVFPYASAEQLASEEEISSELKKAGHLVFINEIDL